MSNALGSPVYELNPESSYYKTIKRVRDNRPKVRAIIVEIGEEHGFDPDEFTYYGSKSFGFMPHSKGYDKFKDQLKKQADHNNVFRFKMASKIYKAISSQMEPVDELIEKGSPFTIHDIFGINNLKAEHWLGDRFFVQVKDASYLEETKAASERKKQYPIEPAMTIKYSEYLELALEAVKEKEEE